MKVFDHLGMRWTGAGREEDGRKMLLAENLDSRRRWSIDPVTGIGEPLLEPAASRAEESIGRALDRDAGRAVGAAAQGNRAVATHSSRRASASEPAVCEHCGAKNVYQIRFSQTEFMTKCLSCKRFVVDGRVERPGRARPRSRRGVSLWLPLE